MKKYDNKGFSMIEVIVVIALAGFALIALSSLFLGTNLTKTTNENLLLASNSGSILDKRINRLL
jgi:prepilin-type N-terminal cleavage/methylation domain-containing protein